MEKNDFLRELENILELEPNTLKGGESLEETGVWDSLGVVSFMAFADEKLGLVLQADKISASKTIEDLIGLLGDRISG